LKPAPEVNLVQIAEKYELSGAAIVNIIQFCGLMALQRKESKLYLEDLQKAITREFEKEGKIL
jgi:ATP-dependent 26S proteasome regulatory subunit